jgi:hypothetical protein
MIVGVCPYGHRGRDTGARLIGGNMPASHQGSMTFPAGRDEVFQACLKAVPQCGFKVADSNPETGQIKARTRMGLRSWGEEIIITVGGDGRADIKSSCRGIQVIDYGKNKANVTALFSALGSLLPPQPQQ